MSDIFAIVKNSTLCNYPDDNILYLSAKTFNEAMSHVKSELLLLKEWFHVLYLTW